MSAPVDHPPPEEVDVLGLMLVAIGGTLVGVAGVWQVRMFVQRHWGLSRASESALELGLLTAFAALMTLVLMRIFGGRRG